MAINYYEVDPPEYRYYVADLLTNEILAEIPFIGVSYERALSKAGSFSGSIPLIEATAHLELYDNTMPGKTALYVLRSGVCVWGGIIWGRQYSPTSKTLSVDANEFVSYLYHRALWQTLYYGSEQYYCSRYEANGSVATLYTEVDHGFKPGEKVRVRNLNPALNGDKTIATVPSPASFTFAVSGVTLASSPSTTGLARTIVDTYDLARDLIGYMSEDFSNLAFANETIKPANELLYSLTNKVMATGTATLTTALPHDLLLGQQVELVDVDTLLNGYQVITAIPSTTSFVVKPAGVTSSFASTAVAPLTTYNITSAEIQTTTLKITTKQVLNNVATMTTSAAHGLAVGDAVSISNITNTISVSKTAASGTSGATTVTITGSNTGVLVGMGVTGAGIGSNATVQSINGLVLTLGVQNVGTVTGTLTFFYESVLNGPQTVIAIPSATQFSFAKTSRDVASTAVTKVGEQTAYTFTNSNNLAYASVIQGSAAATNNPNLYFIRGNTYTLTINSPGYNFWIQNQGGGYAAGKVYSTGVTNNGTASGTITFVVPLNAPSTLYYQAQQTNSMAGVINVTDYGSVSYKSGIITTATNHGLTQGKKVVIEEVGSEYDGVKTVSSIVDTKTFKFNSTSIVNTPAEAVYGGTVKWGGRAVAGTFGAYSGNSDIGIDVSSDLSGKYIGVSQQIFRGSDLKSFGEILEEFSKDVNGFEYRIDCDFDKDIGEFSRTLTFVPFIPPPNKISVTYKTLTSNVATLTTATAHGLVIGQEIVVSDVGISFDGTRLVTGTPTTTTFTFSSIKPNVPGSASSGNIGSVHPISVLGADQYVFEYPGNVLEFGITETTENSATRMWVAGNSDGLDNTPSQPYAAAASTDLMDKGWPLLDQVESKNDTETTAYGESALYSYAKDFVDEARPPEGNFTIAINGSIGPYVGDFLPGDWCSLIIDDEFVRMRLASDLEPRGDVIVRKIVGYKVNVPDGIAFPEKVDLELISEWKEDRRISALKITV
jgi:hypothetical protein